MNIIFLFVFNRLTSSNVCEIGSSSSIFTFSHDFGYSYLLCLSLVLSLNVFQQSQGATVMLTTSSLLSELNSTVII